MLYPIRTDNPKNFRIISRINYSSCSTSDLLSWGILGWELLTPQTKVCGFEWVAVPILCEVFWFSQKGYTPWNQQQFAPENGPKRPKRKGFITSNHWNFPGRTVSFRAVYPPPFSPRSPGKPQTTRKAPNPHVASRRGASTPPNRRLTIPSVVGPLEMAENWWVFTGVISLLIGARMHVYICFLSLVFGPILENSSACPPLKKNRPLNETQGRKGWSSFNPKSIFRGVSHHLFFELQKQQVSSVRNPTVALLSRSQWVGI